MIKMAFFDIDGTLWDERDGLPKSTVEALQELRMGGVAVCICTGRSLGTIYDDVMELELDGMIAGGGTYIALGGKVLRRKAFTKEQAGYCMSVSGRPGSEGISLESSRKVYMDGGAARMLSMANARKWEGMTPEKKTQAMEDGKIICQDNLSTCNPDLEPVHKICYWGSKDGFEEFRHRLGPCRVVQTDDWYGTRFYELVPDGCDKGTAVRLICREAGVRMEETIGFGDGKNDLDFLEITGISVAMENGAAEVKLMADSICECPANHGIYKELIRRGLITGMGKERYDGTEMVAGRGCISNLSQEFLRQ